MEHAQVEEGDTFVMGRGNLGGLAYASGLYRATADLDLKLLYDASMADDRVTMQGDEVTLLVGNKDDYWENRAVRLFQEWLLREGYVERLPCKTLGFTNEYRRKQDDSGAEQVMVTKLNDPFPEILETPSPSLR